MLGQERGFSVEKVKSMHVVACRNFILLIVFIASANALVGFEVQAKSPIASSNNSDATANVASDCTKAEVNFADDPSLTKAEKSELMDKALFQSLAKYDACKSAKEASAAGGQSGGGGGDSGAGGSGSSGEVGVASTEMSGTETVATKVEGEREEAGGGTADGTLPTEGKDEKQGEVEGQLTAHGKLPEDIPPADNDSVLEAQIRQAAINETDPKVKKRLWNEYRRYKNLPIPE